MEVIAGMEKYKHVLREKTDDGIVTITLNRPEVSNAFNRTMAAELLDALHCFSEAEDEWFCILTGTGKAFCSGEDLRNINLDVPKEEKEEFTHTALDSYHSIILAILESQKPIVAALNGTAAGAGMAIALACDERFAVVGEKSMLIPGYADIGLTPDAAMAPLLERLVGYRICTRWLRPGFRISMRNAENSGVFLNGGYDIFFETAVMMNVIREDARKEFLEKRSFSEYCATKAQMNAGMLNKLKTIFPMEIDLQTELEQGDDFREGLMAFREKRHPVFNARLKEMINARREA
jgi:2-(1,2-epoxy-1,2-dihydrophenyl)acetyl-CoA isomerase